MIARRAGLPPYDAVVLAGGRARRLAGVDKPGLLLGERSLLERVADAVADAKRLIVVGPRRERPAHAITVRENPPGGGPVPALRAGLGPVAAPWVAVLAADLPFLTGHQVTVLRRVACGHDGAVLIDDTGAEQWLIGVWGAERLRAALTRYTGATLRGVLSRLDVRRVPATACPGRPPPWLDCDTIEDVARARKWTSSVRDAGRGRQPPIGEWA